MSTNGEGADTIGARGRSATRDLDIDDVSYRQALVDARMANARIVSITQSIAAVSAEISDLREELARARSALSKIEASA